MEIIHSYEGIGFPFEVIEVERYKNSEAQYNTITNLYPEGGYDKTHMIGIWHIKWKNLKLGRSCDSQKENWKN